jgi:transmembrane sensor
MIDRSRPLKEYLRDPVDPARTRAVWRRLRARPAPLGWGWPLFAFASVCALLLSTLWTHRAPHEATPVAKAGALQLRDGGAFPETAASSDHGVQLVLSDASSIELAPGSLLRKRRSTAHELATELVHGAARFAVTPGGPRRWSVRAGTVEVHVVGTRFSVERVGDDVLVAVEHGVVRVEGVTVPDGKRELRATQTLRVAAGLVRPDAAAVAPTPPSDPLEPSLAPPPPPTPTPTPTVVAGAVRPQRVPASVPAGATADQLLAGADALRAAGDAEPASVLLARLLDTHPDDPRAALAAVTLGRLYMQLGQPARAVATLERARQLGLPQALAEQSAALLVLAHARAGDEALARSAAESYRATFPNGRWSAKVRAWAGED